MNGGHWRRERDSERLAFFFIILQHIQGSFTALNPLKMPAKFYLSFSVSLKLSLKLSVEGSKVMDCQKIALSLS